MKKNFSFLLLTFALLNFFLISCRKEITLPDNNKNQTTETIQKVNQWIAINQAKAEPEKTANIRALKEALDFSNLHFEDLYDEEKLVVIPLNKNFISSTNKKDKNPVSVLLIILNKQGNIRKGNIVQFVPTNKDAAIHGIPLNTFHNMYNHKKMSDGTFTFLRITDKPQYSVTYQNDEIKEFSTLAKGKTGGQDAMLQTGENCIDWYWNTYINGILVSSQYLYTTCAGSGCGNVECDEEYPNGDGSGGGGVEAGNSYTKGVNWVVAEAVDNSWYVKSYETLNAEKVGTSPSIFTSIVHSSSAIFNPFGGAATWQVLNTVVYLTGSNSVAVADISGKVTTSLGDIDIQKSKPWLAPTEFP